MTATFWLTVIVLLAAILVTTRFLGAYMAKVYGDNEHAPGDRFFLPIERFIYKLGGIDSAQEQRWSTYALSMLAFSVVSILFLYLLQRVQAALPLNPTGVDNVPPPLAFSTATSFPTNTNWQNYAGENTISHLTQMIALAVQNFVSAAVGMAVAIAFVRGLVRRRENTIGNFWVDLTRSTTRILLPICIVVGVVFVAQGVVQNFTGNTIVSTLEGGVQVVPGGPVASQEAIKELGTNGGGLYNANSAHPFENPNGFTNILQIALILLIPFALTYTFGRMAKDQKQGWVVFGAMFALWIASAALAVGMEARGNPALESSGASHSVTATQPGGNMEGKEVRYGPGASGLYAASTTGTSSGAVNSMHDSYTPLGGMAPLANMMLGEVSPGGVGSGLYGMLIFALLSVFIAGLMVGRTPEYLGKKIQAAEMKLVVIYILAAPIAVLAFAGVSLILAPAKASILNSGPHGLSEVVYAYTSVSNNNGSAFGGLTGNTDWYNTTFGLCMMVGRYVLMIAMLAIAGSLVRKQTVPPSAGTFPTGTPLFGGLLTGIVVIVVGLTYFPVLALGPVVEHLQQI